MMRALAAACLLVGLAGCAGTEAGEAYGKFYRAISLPSYFPSETVYSAGECVGAVVNGACQGTIMPAGGSHPTCHGQMLNGQCTGPMF